MRRIIIGLSALLAATVLSVGASARTIDWAFSYQGELKQSGTEVNGSRAMSFRLYDAAVGGTQVGIQINRNVTLLDGLFETTLDFTNGGIIPGIFDGNDRWLEIVVDGQILTPRQKLATTPHAAFATNFVAPLYQDTAAGTIMHLVSHSTGAQVRGLLVQVGSPAIGAIAVYGEATDTTTNTENVGVYGLSHSGNGFGVTGVNDSPTGNCAAIYGRVDSTQGAGLYALATAATGATKAVYGSVVSSQGFAGYFDGRGYFQRFTGIGRQTPVTGNDLFAVSSPAVTGFGGMYVETAGANAFPFYGYATNGSARAWTYLDGSTDKWHLYHSNATRLTVQDNGFVGIGTTAPAFMLHVNGTAGKPGGGSWSVASDRRLKTNIEPLHGTLDRLLALDGVSFEYRDPGAINERPGPQIGMIAQDVERVFPDWVETGPDGYKRVTYRGFEALTVEALRDLRADSDAQLDAMQRASDDRIATLEQRIAELERIVRMMSRGAE